MTEINLNFKVDPQAVQKITDFFASIPAVLTAHQPAFKRLIAERLDAREADQIVAEIKAIGNYDAGQVGDINQAIQFSQIGPSKAATAQYIKSQVLAGAELQTVLDNVMGN